MLQLLRRPRALAPCRRALSSTAATRERKPDLCVPLERLALQSRLHFQVSDATPTHVEVVPVLAAADFAMNVFASSTQVQNLFSFQEDLAGDGDSVTALRITKNASPSGDVEPVRVQLLLPQLVHLNVSVVNGSIDVQDKVEGDVKLVVGRGDVAVHKVRGQEITLKTNRGAISVSSLVEGENVKLTADSVQCKRLMAGSADVKLGKGESSATSEFGAIYAAACSVTSSSSSGESALQVGNVHGYLHVVGEGLKSVHVDSVTGAFELEDSGDKCSAVAHFDSWGPDATSSISVGGDVHVSLQPAASIDVELHGTSVAVADTCAFQERELDQLDEDYAVFTGKLQAQDGAAASSASGKINLDGAKDDAMRTSFFMKDAGEQREESGEAARQSPRLFVHAMRGRVTLEQLDWMANLKRKHLKK